MKGMVTAIKAAQENKAMYVRRSPDWKGRECWLMFYYDPKEKAPQIGFPQYILTDGRSYRLMNQEETLDYIAYVDKEYGYDNNGEIKGFEEQELVKVTK